VKQFFTVGSRDRNRFRDAEARRNGLGFVANTPTGFDLVASAAPWLRRFPGTFDVLPALRRLLGDARYDEYVVACAYLDTAGAAVLKLALDRGARVVLVMPRTPNVYRDANAKALKRLMDEHGNFSVSREGEQNASRKLERREKNDGSRLRTRRRLLLPALLRGRVARERERRVSRVRPLDRLRVRRYAPREGFSGARA
jgi:hypothetical protein